MPTFNCFTSPGTLTAENKMELADWLAAVYLEQFHLARIPPAWTALSDFKGW